MAADQLTPVAGTDEPSSTTRDRVRTGLIGAALGFVIALMWPRPWKS